MRKILHPTPHSLWQHLLPAAESLLLFPLFLIHDTPGVAHRMLHFVAVSMASLRKILHLSTLPRAFVGQERLRRENADGGASLQRRRTTSGASLTSAGGGTAGSASATGTVGNTTRPGPSRSQSADIGPSSAPHAKIVAASQTHPVAPPRASSYGSSGARAGAGGEGDFASAESCLIS